MVDIATVPYVDAADALKAPLASPTFTGTVNGVTKAMVGLGNVDNTSDANKPVSTAQAAADTAISNRLAQFETAPVLRRNVRGAFSVATSAFTLLPLDGTDGLSYDSEGNQWSSATPDRLLCRRSGYYQVNCGFHLNASTGGRMFIRIAINGTDIRAGAGDARGNQAEQGVHTSFLYPLTNGDFMTMTCYQDSGAAQAVSTSPYASSFIDWRWVRPL